MNNFKNELPEHVDEELQLNKLPEHVDEGSQLYGKIRLCIISCGLVSIL